ncbi:MAG: aspartate/glutamate racemase family protein [Deltaproteobacteria bacterium]|nr:aspartate/glutamate racemase family protein [Deltaproteobacteria bacterium]
MTQKKPKTPVIMVTDSGLGGVSILAHLLHRLKTGVPFHNPHKAECIAIKHEGFHVWRYAPDTTRADTMQKLMPKRVEKTFQGSKVRVVYFNAMPDYAMGYNDMKDERQKIFAFNAALTSAQKKFDPALTLIASNTLSALYPHTDFKNTNTAPVKTIAETALKLMLDFLHKHARSRLVILGTPTTIASGLYTMPLAQNHIPPKRMITEPCPDLHNLIVRNIVDPHIEKKISTHIMSALGKIAKGTRTALCLCCTHYGFAVPLFQKILADFDHNVTLINPNLNICDDLLVGCKQKTRPAICIKIVSQAKIHKDDIGNVCRLVKETAPEIALALKGYQHVPDFFKWRL